MTDPIVGAFPVVEVPGAPPPVWMPIADAPDVAPVPSLLTPDPATVLPFPPLGNESAVGAAEPGVVSPEPSPVLPPDPETLPVPIGDLLPVGPNAGAQPPTDIVADTSTAIGDGLDDLLIQGMTGMTGALPYAAALGVASLTAVSIARGVCSPGAAVVFTNVRLVPCLVSAAVERTAMVGSQVVSGYGSPGASAGGARAGKRASLPAVVGAIVDPIRDGFEDAVARRPRAEDAEGLRDARLLMQIGIVLGTIYLAFLTVWFWATRVRLKPRV